MATWKTWLASGSDAIKLRVEVETDLIPIAKMTMPSALRAAALFPTPPADSGQRAVEPLPCAPKLPTRAAKGGQRAEALLMHQPCDVRHVRWLVCPRVMDS